MKRHLPFLLTSAWALLCAVAVVQAAPAAYDGPWISSTVSFPVGATQPQGAYCMVNGMRRIEGVVANATGQAITAFPAKVPLTPRCRADTLRHDDIVVMYTTRLDMTGAGVSPPLTYKLSNLYGCRPYKTEFLCNVKPMTQTVTAVPPVVTPPVGVPPVVVPPVVTPPASTPATWVEGVREGEPLGVPAGTSVRLCYWDTCTPAKPATAGAVCSVDFFGSDPAPGKGKSCWVLK